MDKVFRAVCTKHKWELEPTTYEPGSEREGSVKALYRNADGTYSWDLSEFACPYWSLAASNTSEEVYDTIACNDRWYIIDGAGAPVFQTWHDEDKFTFARIDPFKSWRHNLGFDVERSRSDGRR
jgi:hypothetical protein